MSESDNVTVDVIKTNKVIAKSVMNESAEPLTYETRSTVELEEKLARVSIRDLRSHLSEILNEADYKERDIVITKNGQPTIVLVPARKYAEYTKPKKEE